MLLLLPWACDRADDPPPRDDGPAATTAETGTPPDATGDTGPTFTTWPDGCTIDPQNALRAWCAIPDGATADLRVELVRTGTTSVRTFRPDAALGTGILLWGMPQDTDHDWRILDEGAGIDDAGTLRTGVLPAELEPPILDVTVNEPSAQLEAVLLSPTCPGGWLFLADRDGQVIWYQDGHVGTEGTATLNAIQWTEDQTVLLDATRMSVREIDLAGNVRLHLERGIDFPDYVHHDLFRAGGLTYALRAREGVIAGDDVVIDGVYVFDAAGAMVDEIDLQERWPYSVEPYMSEGYWGGMFPGAVDFSHANSVFVDPAGDVIVSLRHLAAFSKFQGGPGTPGFGTMLWTAVGDPASPIQSVNDFVVSGPVDATFQGQHDVNVAADGTIVMLDNGFPLGQPTRGVRYAIDEAGRTLTLLDEWHTGQTCPVLGGARAMPGGNVLVACDSSGTMFEFTPGSPDPVWQARVRCDSFVATQVPRAVPLSLGATAR